jgi:hypothetical protein
LAILYSFFFKGGRLRGLFKSSKLYVGTMLVLPWPVTFSEGASYTTKNEDETPVSIAALLGMEKDVRDLVRRNKSTYKGLNSKSKLLRGTILSLPARTHTELRVVSRATKRSQWLK